ncbi:MAG TPA: hypothetical protein VN238_20620, partial [Solirubrobacteraceae bacterium]|nr:hypothetical protein [Solirubrobacteraceae bacterium]
LLPGGLPDHGDLLGVRRATKAALQRATQQVSGARASRPPGVVDAMQLLPGAITHRVATRVQANVDGVASNVGPIPEHVAHLGPYRAAEVHLLAAPLRNDLTLCLGRQDGCATLGVIADPARLGPGGDLRERVAAELSAWGVTATVW